MNGTFAGKKALLHTVRSSAKRGRRTLAKKIDDFHAHTEVSIKYLLSNNNHLLNTYQRVFFD